MRHASDRPSQLLKTRFLTFAPVILVLLCALLSGWPTHAAEVEAPEERARMIPDSPFFIAGSWLQLFPQQEFGAEITLQTRYGKNSKGVTQKGVLLKKGNKTLLQIQPESAKDLRKGKATVIITIAHPDDHKGFVVYESLSGYAEIPTPPSWSKPWQATRTPLGGREKHDGHSCTRTQISLSAPDLPIQLFTVCAAPTPGTDEKDFPFHIETRQNDRIYSLELSKVKFDPIDDSLFSAPDGATRYATVESMTVELMTRMGGAGGNRRIFEGPQEPPLLKPRTNPLAPDTGRR